MKTYDVMWRDTGGHPQIFFVNARIMFPIAIWALHMSKATLVIAVAGVVFFWLLERHGYEIRVLYRIVIRFFIGNRKICRSVLLLRYRVLMSTPYDPSGNPYG